MPRRIRRVSDEEMDQLERDLEEDLRTHVDSSMMQPRWRRFYEIQIQREEELRKARSEQSQDDNRE